MNWNCLKAKTKYTCASSFLTLPTQSRPTLQHFWQFLKKYNDDPANLNLRGQNCQFLNWIFLLWKWQLPWSFCSSIYFSHMARCFFFSQLGLPVAWHVYLEKYLSAIPGLLSVLCRMSNNKIKCFATIFFFLKAKYERNLGFTWFCFIYDKI